MPNMAFYLMILSLMSTLWFRNSIIKMLLSLELLLISCFISLLSISSSSSPFSLLFFLTIMVSGSVLGLSLLVASSRHHYSSSSFFIFSMMFDKNHYPHTFPLTNKI